MAFKTSRNIQLDTSIAAGALCDEQPLDPMVMAGLGIGLCTVGAAVAVGTIVIPGQVIGGAVVSGTLLISAELKRNTGSYIGLKDSFSEDDKDDAPAATAKSEAPAPAPVAVAPAPVAAPAAPAAAAEPQGTGVVVNTAGQPVAVASI